MRRCKKGAITKDKTRKYAPMLWYHPPTNLDPGKFEMNVWVITLLLGKAPNIKPIISNMKAVKLDRYLFNHIPDRPT